MWIFGFVTYFSSYSTFVLLVYRFVVDVNGDVMAGNRQIWSWKDSSRDTSPRWSSSKEPSWTPSTFRGWRSVAVSPTASGYICVWMWLYLIVPMLTASALPASAIRWSLECPCDYVTNNVRWNYQLPILWQSISTDWLTIMSSLITSYHIISFDHLNVSLWVHMHN